MIQRPTSKDGGTAVEEELEEVEEELEEQEEVEEEV